MYAMCRLIDSLQEEHLHSNDWKAIGKITYSFGLEMRLEYEFRLRP